uniref:PH domain-containing protein n=1 Tax=Heterorhabditis bacteriophora TaxID=37862 RepID=A0A1I7W6D8_HETBA
MEVDNWIGSLRVRAKREVISISIR